MDRRTDNRNTLGEKEKNRQTKIQIEGMKIYRLIKGVKDKKETEKKYI